MTAKDRAIRFILVLRWRTRLAKIPTANLTFGCPRLEKENPKRLMAVPPSGSDEK
jgi:hypothetical protein